MYDFYTLKAVLEEADFASGAAVDAFTSRITGWANFALDVNPDGTEYKPGSLYCEAVRPGSSESVPEPWVSSGCDRLTECWSNCA